MAAWESLLNTKAINDVRRLLLNLLELPCVLALPSTMPRSMHASSSSLSISPPTPRPDDFPSPPLSSSAPKRPSLATTMNWLSRTPNTANVAYAPSKPVKISEPKLVRGIDNLTHPRNGALGTGATVVRTPDEALRETGVRGPDARSQTKSPKPKKEKKASISKTIGYTPGGFPLNSPPLPPLPTAESDEERILSSSDYDVRVASPSPKRPALTSARSMPNAPTVGPVPVPRSPSLRPSLKIRSTLSADEAVVPPLPSVPASPCPPFKPILMSDLPKLPVDPEKVVITIETCTAAYKTTLETVKSRPSHLSRYLDSLLAQHRSESSASSVYSSDNNNSNLRDGSDIHSVFSHQQQGFLVSHRSFSNIHIFLDRPSSPYAHVLAYLRSTPGATPECIPRSVQYQQPTPAARLESLIELRDEAAYLKLEALHRLCVDEIRKGHQREALVPPTTAAKTHTRGGSTSGQSVLSVHSMSQTSSMGHNTTMQPVRERVETDGADDGASIRSIVDAPLSDHHHYPMSAPPPMMMLPSRRDNSLSDHSSSAPSTRGPSTPQSWDHRLLGHARNQSVPVTSRNLKSPPPGWI